MLGRASLLGGSGDQRCPSVEYVPDRLFTHPRLAAIYDVVEAVRDDLEAYVRIANEFAARSVLDVGCGTGCLALLLSAAGHQVVGVDPAEASIEVARAKPGADQITWLHGHVEDLPDLKVDLATMTGNVAQVFVGDDDWETTLTSLARVIRPGGHIVFESRRPESRAWEEWASDTGPWFYDIPGQGRVRQDFAVTSVSLPLVSFRYTYTFESDGEVIESDSTLRFRDLPELRRSLRAAGFVVRDVRQAPDRPGREYVVLAQR